ncbi:complex I intermediate-associated protein 30-domain-containing protein [Aspergillus varians]
MLSHYLATYSTIHSVWPGNWQGTGLRSVKSIAYVDIAHHTHIAQSEFHGWLDRDSVDNMGFASMQTTGSENTWDLSGYDAIELVLGKSDGKIYTISLEDDRAFSWRGRFRYENVKGLTIPTTRVIRFTNLEPDHRDQEMRPLDLTNIRRFELGIRRSDGIQEGSFSLSIHSINVVKLPCTCPAGSDPVIDRLGRRSFGQEMALLWQKAKNTTMVVAFYLRLTKPKARLRERRSLFSR